MVIVWTHSAKSSLASIALYVGRHFGKRKADEVLRQIVAFANALQYSPRIGKRLEEWSLEGEDVRCAVFKQNQIYYTVVEDEVFVIVVWDGRQDPMRLRAIVRDFIKSKKLAPHKKESY